MKQALRTFILASVCLLASACVGARTGVVDGALTTNTLPTITIRADAPFTLANCGRAWSSPRNFQTFGAATTSVDYALYTDKAAAPGTRLVFGAIIRLENPESWHFVPQGNTLPGSFGPRQPVEPASLDGYAYTLYVPATGDWPSQLLAVNGVSVPEAWIARRMVYSLANGERALAEYREAWPAEIAVPDSPLVLSRKDFALFLQNFTTRAVAAITVDAVPGVFTGAPPSSSWQEAPIQPDVATLVGEIYYMDRSPFAFD